ncbi:MAG: glycosyltransferase [Pseudomonadota bacterium]
MTVKRLILITGMHRSGTSVVTRLCNILGADIGGEMLPATPDNPKGYWENAAAFNLHASVFDAFGQSWNALPALPEGWAHSPTGDAVTDQLKTVIDTEFTGALAVLKDPKLCRLLPLWDRVCADLSIEPLAIMALRHPVAVARSLVKRDGMGFETALLLWLRHTLEAERDSRDYRRAISDYDMILADWRAEMQSIASQLDLTWPVVLEDVASTADGFVSKDLRHNHAHDDAAGDDALTGLCIAIYQALLAAREGALNTQVLDQGWQYLAPLEPVSTVLNEQAKAHIDAVNDAALKGQIEAALRDEIAIRDRSLIEQEDEHRERIAEYDTMVRAREAERDNLREHIAQLSEEMATARQSTSAQEQELDRLRQEMHLIINSRSWRVTKPLRAFNTWRSQRVPHYRYLMVRLLQALKKGDFAAINRAVRHRLAGVPQPASSADFADWSQHFDTLDDTALASLQVLKAELSDQPMISIVVPVYRPPLEILRQAVQSVRDQIYDQWELCLVDDGGQDPAVSDLLALMASEDSRIKVQINQHNQNIAGATNDAFALATGDYVAMMDHDDVLRPHALLMMAKALREYPDARVLYSDEDKVDENNRRYAPYFKPAWNRELFYSQNYLNHLTLIRKDLVDKVGGWRPGFDGSQDYDLLLRVIEQLADDQIVHVPLILYHWRAIEGSAATEIGTKSEAAGAGERALAEHFQRLGQKVVIEPGALDYGLDGYYRVRHAIPAKPPRVSLIVPTKDQLTLTKGCLDGLLDRTDYPNLEILLVDNNSEKAETLAYFDSVAHDSRVRVLRYQEPFNFSAINNFAAKRASGDVIGLLNNDTEVIEPDWLTEMVSHAIRPDVGCVGAKLYYANDQVQHAGVIVGLGGVAGHSHKYFPRSSAGYFGRLVLTQELTAVTAACLLLRKTVFDEVGGLDEDLVVAFNDVDFCLRVREAGYRNLYTPYAALYHLESVSRGLEDTPAKLKRFHSEMTHLKDRWADQLLWDHAYSPNLSLDTENFALANPPRSLRPWAPDQWPGTAKKLARINNPPKQKAAHAKYGMPARDQGADNKKPASVAG